MPRTLSLTELARAGFASLDQAAALLSEASAAVAIEGSRLLGDFARAADPDRAAEGIRRLASRHPERLRALAGDEEAVGRLILLAGASGGLLEFFLRRPEALARLRGEPPALAEGEHYRRALLAAVGERSGFAAVAGEEGWVRLRTAYRAELTSVALWDLTREDPVAAVEPVAAALSQLAEAALEAALAIARRTVTVGTGSGQQFPEEEVRAARLAIIAMGKTGAGEVNYVSDVDVIFVADPPSDGSLGAERAVQIGTRLAMETMRAISGLAVEPALWEVDPNLRPEGKDGALVRTLASHIAYYDRWAQSWEFQALLKARPVAGDAQLGQAYLDALWPKVWASAGRENFVDSVQRMRERVTANIPDADVAYQLKLGPGGLRDVEFTVQLLQLVHGRSDESLRVRGTLPALRALAAGGYIGREESAAFARDYELLRLLEHRLQLDRLTRTALMPRTEAEQRRLARATGLVATAEELLQLWSDAKLRVRGLHERLFYRPLLAAAASIPVEGADLSSEQAEARLQAIGFRDPHGALTHIAALTRGVRRRAAIQRTLLPVLLQWFALGADPDYGLLAFRRLSERLGDTPWFLRLLRDSNAAAQRLTTLLSGSRFVGELLDTLPEAVAWLEDDASLVPRDDVAVRTEVDAILQRHDTVEPAATAIRHLRRREVLRAAMGYVLGVVGESDTALALSRATQATLDGILRAVRGNAAARGGDGIEFAIIGMGRFGGQELGFGSDADVLYVYRPVRVDPETAGSVAHFIVGELTRLTEDTRLPLELDLDLRPEGKQGPVTRTLDAYRAYYERWSLTWEAQALLRARAVAGDAALAADFEALADRIRYPQELSAGDARQIRRLKARVESERLPQGVDPLRHVKLGRGSLSDVEWFVQLIQLRHGHAVPGLRTTSTLRALAAAVEAGYVEPEDAARLRAAWQLAARVRSGITLWSNRSSDVLPEDGSQLEGIARLLGYPPHSGRRMEQDYLAVTRRARAVFEREFYGES